MSTTSCTHVRSPRWLVVLPAVLLAATLVVGACGGDGDTVSVSEESAERSTTSAPSGADADSPYCAAAREVTADDGGLDLSEDAAAAVARVERLAATAPEDLQDDFATFIDGIDGIAELEEDSPDALAAIFELMTDERFADAATAIEDFTVQECGIELGATLSSEDSSETTSGADESEPGEIELSDVDDVKDAYAGSTWADKLSTTAISGLADVQVSTSGDDLTPAEALEACSALLTALSGINPEVSVAVGNGETVVAESSGGSCTTV